MVLNIALFIASFFAIWFGAGLIVSSVENLSHRLRISSFATSFFVLGILTSIPEASVGINSILNRDPEIFVGNLIGASLVLFVLAIPILAILGNGIRLAHQLNDKTLPLALLVVAAPSFFIIDKRVTMFEGIFLVILYLLLFYLIEKRKGLLENIKDKITDGKTRFLEDIFTIILGAIVVFISSNIIVDKTIFFSSTFGISAFLISLLVLSVGTNLPELSLAIRSVTLGKKEIALGDYLGSAAANTFFFGLLTVVNQKEIVVINHFLQTFIFMVLGLSLFFYFTRSKNDISRKEGLILLFIYFAFVLVESIS